MPFESPTHQSHERSDSKKTAESLTRTEMTSIKNEIQVALMEDFGIPHGDKTGALDWIKKYAKDFSDYLHEHPQYTRDWSNGHKEAVLEALIQAEEAGFPLQEM